MEVERKISFGKGEKGKRIHIIVDVDFFSWTYLQERIIRTHKRQKQDDS